MRRLRVMVACLALAIPGFAAPPAACAQTLTVYGTAPGQSGPAYAGGTISAGDTVRIDDGASVSGAIANSGTLQFNQTSGSLSLTGSYTGGPTAMLSLTNGGTVGLLQSTTTTIIDGAVDVRAGRLSTGTAALFIGSTGTGSLSISGNGSVATTFVRFASGESSTALFTMSGGTFTNTALGTPGFYFASGSASSGTFTMTGGTANFGNGSGGGFAYGPNSTATMTLSGGTMSWNWFEPAEGDNSTATLTISGSATRLNATSYIRMSLGANSVSTMTVDGGVVNGSQFRLGSGVGSVSTFTVTGGSVGFNGTGATTNGNMVGAAAGSSGTITFTGGTTTFAGPTFVGGLGTSGGGGVSRGLVKVEGGVITTNTAASGSFSAVEENHFALGRFAPTTGEMVVTGGTFTAQRDFYVGGSGTGTLTLSGGSGRMQVGRLFISSTVNSSMANTGGAGSVTVSSGTLLVTGSGDAANLRVGTNSSGTGSLTINGSGVVIVGGTLTQGAVGGITLGPGGTLQIGSGTSNGVLLGGTGSLLNNGTLVFHRRSDFTYRGVISGSGAFVKRGNAWGTLQSENTYTGLTSVEAGTLLLNGSGGIGSGGLSLAAGTRFDIGGLTSSTYTLPATGNLFGSGTISGTGKTLAVLGSFLPGSTNTGTFSLASGLSLDLSAAAGSVLKLTDPTYAAGTYDLVSGSGNVTFGGPLTLAFSNGPFADGSDVVRLFTNTGALSGTFSSVMATGLQPGQSVLFDATTGYVTIVPEPTPLVIGGAGLAALGGLLLRRRRCGAAATEAALSDANQPPVNASDHPDRGSQSTRRRGSRACACLCATLAVFGLGSAGIVHAQSTTWDSMLSNSYWYVPRENLLAYMTSGTSFTDPIPTAGSDQTVWSLGTATNGSFTGTATGTFRPLDFPLLAISNTDTITSGIVTNAGQIRMTFVGVTSGQPTIGIGQVRTISGTDYMQMQMITGDSSVLTTHWAYMAKYDPNTFVPPSLFPDGTLLSPEWKWTDGSTWQLQSDDLFGTGGSGTFTITNYRNGYFWGPGTGPSDTAAATYTQIGSITPEGNVLFNVLIGGTLTSLAGEITGTGLTGQMVLRTYDGTSFGTAGYATVVAIPEPSTCVLALAGVACCWSLWRRRST